VQKNDTAMAASRSRLLRRTTLGVLAAAALALTGRFALDLHQGRKLGETAVSSWWQLHTPAHDRARLTVAEALAQAQSGAIRLIDIRTPREWEQTGLPQGAVPLDMRRPDFLAALDQLTGGNRAAPVALICARGVRSARLSRALQEAGDTDQAAALQGDSSPSALLSGAMLTDDKRQGESFDVRN
jgi:rhodanese-related sulfurtransferase